MTDQIVKFNITDPAIHKMVDLYMDLTVAGVDDKDGFSQVHDARMVVKNHRVAVEKKRKELKSDALAWGRTVDSEAKRITALLAPIEEHLSTEEGKVQAELDRIKADEDEKARVQIQARVDSLMGFGVVLPYQEVATMTDAEFSDKYLESEASFEANLAAEKKRIEESVAEENRLEGIAKAQEAIAKKQAKSQKKIDDANAKLAADQKILDDAKKAEADRVAENERAAADHKAHLEAEAKFKEEVKLKAQQDYWDKADREAQDKANAEAEEKRQKALRPDKEKLAEFVDGLGTMLVDAIDCDAGLSESESEGLLNEMVAEITVMREAFHKKIEEL